MEKKEIKTLTKPYFKIFKFERKYIKIIINNIK